MAGLSGCYASVRGAGLFNTGDNGVIYANRRADKGPL